MNRCSSLPPLFLVFVGIICFLFVFFVHACPRLGESLLDPTPFDLYPRGGELKGGGLAANALLSCLPKLIHRLPTSVGTSVVGTSVVGTSVEYCATRAARRTAANWGGRGVGGMAGPKTPNVLVLNLLLRRPTALPKPLDGTRQGAQVVVVIIVVGARRPRAAVHQHRHHIP